METRNQILLTPVEMTQQVMKELEAKGLILRLCPGQYDLKPETGETLDRSIYETDERYGPHNLISVTVNRSSFTAFGTHQENEEFLLIGNPETKPMYLVLSLCSKDTLQEKIVNRELAATDFICLRVRYNDPEVSFFTMLADVPHGEAVADIEGKPPSFYVTKPKGLNLDITDFGKYQLTVEDDISDVEDSVVVLNQRVANYGSE